ncbi:flagellar biosynthesis protein FlhF [Virgibacillus sp. MG-45]|uniref:flagellar biosynthesis protein FlhF n=1 Tax=Virgibacillus sp. MG-45 TaxID=3102791 RepID=UPI002EDA6B84
MKIKKYVAPTMPEAMHQIRKELGTDAVILNSKEVQKGGFLGFFKKRKIEVIAALDPNPIRKKPQAETMAFQEPNLKKKPFAQKKLKQDDPVLMEIKYLKKMMEQQAAQQPTTFPPTYQPMYEHLVEQELEAQLAASIINKVIELHDSLVDAPSTEQIVKDTLAVIEKQLSPLTFEGISYQKKIVQFVGPTGVGKTTTIAKLAANSVLKDKKRVAFITTDTYRIAAIEQLKTYASILDVPIEVAYSLDDYKRAVNQYKDYDLILVDTAGRNFRDDHYVQELKNTIDLEKNVETYLVLSLTAKQQDLIDVVNQFSGVPIKEMIFTKMDETSRYGSIATLALLQGMGIAYITNGQDVPDDIIMPTPYKISKFLVGEFIDG